MNLPSTRSDEVLLHYLSRLGAKPFFNLWYAVLHTGVKEQHPCQRRSAAIWRDDRRCGVLWARLTELVDCRSAAEVHCPAATTGSARVACASGTSCLLPRFLLPVFVAPPLSTRIVFSALLPSINYVTCNCLSLSCASPSLLQK